MPKKGGRPASRHANRPQRLPPRPSSTGRLKPAFPAPNGSDVSGGNPTAPRERSVDVRQPSLDPAQAERVVAFPSRPNTQASRPSFAGSPVAGRIREGPRLFTDYSYVRRDLLRIAALASGMLLILIVLTFILK